jgi:FtsP/CotA-like multicopper oxidase with cupredoxin domain
MRPCRLLLVSILSSWWWACGVSGDAPGSIEQPPVAAGDDAGAAVSRADGRPGGPPTPSGPPTQPPGWADGVKLAEAPDLNADPRIVEVKLEAKVATVELRPGKPGPAWTYNGTVPGPLIRAKVGDRLIVHFKNNLPAETTIHWHGLRIPVDQDGVPGHSQSGIRPGGSFKYDFTLPDAGLYWFHPHVDSAAQQGDGLYGTILVEDPKEPQGFGDEVVLQLSDISVDEEGQLRERDIGGNVATLFGREGELVLVNGKVRPTLTARAGLRQRWRIVNSAKSRYFQLALPGHTFIRIGGDGGLIPTPVEVERPVIVPGERVDLVVVPKGAPGTSVSLRWVAFDRGYGSAFMRPDVDLMTIAFAPGASAAAPPPLPATGRTIAPLDLSKATQVAVRFTRADVNGKFYLGVNGEPMHLIAPFKARVGETQVWTIDNALDWSHPFHLHGFFFQVLDDAGNPTSEWKDTIDVPYKKMGQAAGPKVRIAVKFEDRAGMWMFHCHILDHSDAGMGGMIDLQP